MCRRITVTTLLVMAALLLVGVGPASAAQSPAGCTNNDFVMNLGKSVNSAHIGDPVTYTVSVGNPNTSGSGCDVDINTASGTAPNGVTTNLPACTGSFPIGTPVTVCGTFTYTIAAADVQNNNVTASATVDGLLHDNPEQDDALDVTKAVSILILSPSITVTKECADAVAGSLIPFQGTVTNNGNASLVNVTCTDDPAPDQFTPPANTLAPGASSAFSGSYTPTANPSSDTVTCSGTDSLGLTVSAQATATCDVLCSPAISVAKACTDATAPGQPINFSGSVSNTGNVPLDVSCTEDLGPVDNPAFPTQLDAGNSGAYGGSYVPSTNPSTDHVICTGTPPPICNLPPVTGTAEATCSTPCNPSFTVAKTCTDASAPGQPINYTGTVTSTGNEGVSCTLSDSPAGTGPNPSSFNVNAGGSNSATGSYVPTQSPSTDTFSATCVPLDSICGTTPVTQSATATCNVPVSHTLTAIKACTTDGTTVNFTGTLSYTGNEDLNNVSCTDSTGAAVSVAKSTLSAPSDSTIFMGSYPFTVDPATDTVTCTGTGAFSGATVEATATATCTPPEAALGCRITAGGVTPNGDADSEDFADATDDTFGGQVGAPCGCIGAFDSFNNIQGNWTVMRKGPGLGSFHATGFNSLVCGCDPTPGNGVVRDLTGLLTGQLCNPGNRNTGPFPPNAPANLACFTGIGAFNPTSGPRTVEVAFRVEVEDRSQPGAGKNSGDSPSVHRIRIWVPTGSETAEGLAEQVACTGPLGDDFCPDGVRDPDIDDGDNGLVHGAIQIHPQIPSHVDICPVPAETCPQPLTCPEPQ
jgi:hypothetical protein